MKRLILIIILLIQAVLIQAQTERVITKTPRAEHTVSKLNGVYCVDSEAKPFSGKFVELGDKNELLKETHYKAGKIHGECIEYFFYKDSVYIKSKANYVNDIQVGKYILYWRPNQKRIECYYNQKGEIHGKYIEYAGFAVEEIEVIGKYINGKKDSIWVSYYPGLKVRETNTYKLGRLNGIYIQYYENGQKQSECNYLNGNMDGKEERWSKNGTLYYVANYKNGQFNGEVLKYYANGKIESEGNYLNGIKKGKFVWYNKDGAIIEEASFN